ncbi:MAG: HU family DNA-binding protein [Deltaproteobacteria bacterium]|jgi:DNA-binding protein HU-beta|nr:HU family DNA-binding protein [Deltaproteobacteria bacterium]
MKKYDLISTLANEAGTTQAQARVIIDGLVDTILDTLKTERRFAISGLGVFHLVKRSKRIGRNPQNGEKLTIKAHNAIKFKPARSAKNELA